MRAGLVAAGASLVLSLALGAPAARAVEQEASRPAIPYKQESRSAQSDVLRLVGAMAVCGIVLGGVLLVLRRRYGMSGGPPRKRKYLELLETQRLGPRCALHVVRFGGVVYLVAQGEHAINTVATAADIPATPGDSQ